MIPTERLTAAAGCAVTTPFPFWNELNLCTGGAAPGLPPCAGPNLHLGFVT